jgi:hypothetical protein
MPQYMMNPGTLAAAGAWEIAKAGQAGDAEHNPKPDSKKARHARQARWRERNQLAVWAQAGLRSALKRGLIERQPCAVCGAQEAEAHHDNFDAPIDVQWLCRAHHKRLHAAEKRAAE